MICVYIYIYIYIIYAYTTINRYYPGNHSNTTTTFHIKKNPSEKIRTSDVQAIFAAGLDAYKARTRLKCENVGRVQGHSAREWPPRHRKIIKTAASAQGSVQGSRYKYFALGKMSAGQMFYTIKERNNFFILGRVSSG